MKKLMIVLCFNLIFISCQTDSGLILEYANPIEANLSPEILQDAVKLYHDAVVEEKIHGFQVLVARNSKIVLHEAGGFRDAVKKLPMQKNTLINMASITKPVVAMGIIKLADEGKVSLKEKVSHYLEGFDSGRSSEITIEQLLLHRGGFTRFDPFHEGVTLDTSIYSGAPSLIYEAKKIGEAGPEQRPGTFTRYNNMGYNILAAIIEKVSNQKLDYYLEQNFYKPLGMNETSHFPYGVDSSRTSKLYWKLNGQWQEVSPWNFYFPRGNAGIVSTTRDFSTYFQMLLNNGSYNGKRFLQEESVKKATSKIIEIDEAYLPESLEKSMGLGSQWYEYRDKREMKVDNYRGYGFVIADNGAYSHAGYYGTFAYIDPNENLIILLFTQSAYGGNPGQKFINKVYEAILDK